MDPVTTALLGAFGGAIIGGTASFLTAWVTSTWQRDLEVERRTLAKFEEIHVAASKLAHQAGITFAFVVGHLSHGRPFHKDDLGGTVDNARLSMLVNFYAPGLRPFASEMDALSLDADWVPAG